jgi:hypothetical protein
VSARLCGSGLMATHGPDTFYFCALPFGHDGDHSSEADSRGFQWSLRDDRALAAAREQGRQEGLQQAEQAVREVKTEPGSVKEYATDAAADRIKALREGTS